MRYAEKSRHLRFGFPVLGLQATVAIIIGGGGGAEWGLSAANVRLQGRSVEEATWLRNDRDLEVALKERSTKQDIVQMQKPFYLEDLLVHKAQSSFPKRQHICTWRRSQLTSL